MHMVSTLSYRAWPFQRIEAEPSGNDNMGFFNAASRSNWLSHEKMLTIASNIKEKVLILEDDVLIVDTQQVLEAINLIDNYSWDVLYFHGSEEFAPIQGVLHTHAYCVNPNSIQTLLSLIIARRHEIEITKPQTKDTFLDQFMAQRLQSQLQFWGTKPLIIQDQQTFGSDTGWGWAG